MPSGGRRGCRRRSGSPPPRLSRRAARPHNRVRPPRSESRPKRTSSRSRGVLYFWLCRWSRRENILRAEPPRDTPHTKAPLTPQPRTGATRRLPATAPRRTTLGAGGKGVDLFDFGTGDPREPTDGKIRRALIEGVPEISRYPSTTGKQRLREAFCGWMERRHGVALDPESEVLPATGSKEAIFHAPLAFLHHSHERRGVAYGTPGYPVYG